MKLRDTTSIIDHRRHYSKNHVVNIVKNDKKMKKEQLQSSVASFPSSATSFAARTAVPCKTNQNVIKTTENNAMEQNTALDFDCRLKTRTNDTSRVSFYVSNTVSAWGTIKEKRPEIRDIRIRANHCVTDALHHEILDYTTSIKLRVEKTAVHIEEMIANVRASVLSMWPQSKVETFGSYSTGIWLPSSDVDLVILNVVEVRDSMVTARYLRELAKALEKKHWVESLLVLETAKVPVLKLISAGTSVPIDITFESAATHSGLLARDLIKRYAENMPELYPLAILFKQLLRERDLNDAYTGGLSSYSVVLMLIHFLQLWRNGDLCFEAASIYASGSLPPVPSLLASKDQAMKLGRQQTNSTVMNGSIDVESKCDDLEASRISSQRLEVTTAGVIGSLTKSAPLPLSTPAVSYAAIVSRAKQPLNKCSRDTSSAQPLSYAAVAAGNAKVSEKKKATDIPSSYAAAVSAPAAVLSSSAKTGKSAVKKPTRDAHLLDAISVSSSNADTEDSSSLCSHSSSTDSDDESAKLLAPQFSASLGEHTMLILEFFGMIFDYRKNGLSVRDGGYIYRLADSHRLHVGSPALVIEDPIHPDRNVSASSFAFSKVVALFEDSYYALKYFRVSKFAPSALSCLLSSFDHTTSNMNHSRSKVQAVRS